MGPTPTSCARRFSVSNDLKYDAERDLRDIDASSIAVHALNKVGASPHPPPGVGAALPVRLRMRTHVHPSFQIKYGDNTTSEGVLFATYSALIGESQAGGQHRTRIRQILEWCGSAFDGVVSWPAQGWGGGGGPTGEGLQGRGRGSGRGAASPGGVGHGGVWSMWRRGTVPGPGSLSDACRRASRSGSASRLQLVGLCRRLWVVFGGGKVPAGGAGGTEALDGCPAAQPWGATIAFCLRAWPALPLPDCRRARCRGLTASPAPQTPSGSPLWAPRGTRWEVPQGPPPSPKEPAGPAWHRRCSGRPVGCPPSSTAPRPPSLSPPQLARARWVPRAPHLLPALLSCPAITGGGRAVTPSHRVLGASPQVASPVAA